MNGKQIRRFAGIIIILSGAAIWAWWWVERDARTATQPALFAGPTDSRAEPGSTERGANRNAEPRSGSADAEGAFDFPFLGKVPSRVTQKEFKVNLEDGGTLTIPFRVYLDNRGAFRRAEFAPEGTAELEWPVQHIQEAIDARDHKVLGFPKTPAPVSWQTIVGKIAQKVPIQSVKRMNVTYVEYQLLDHPPMPLFIVNVFGVDAMPPSAHGEVEEKWRRTRFLFSASGELFIMDNCL